MAEIKKDVNRLGTYHISNTLHDYETARSNFFTLIVDIEDQLLYPQYTYNGENSNNQYIMGSSKAANTPQEVIKLSVNKMFVPHFDLGMIEIKRGNSSVKFADSPTWQSGTMELQDFVGLETKNVLMAWQALAYDVNTDMQGRAGDWTDSEGNARKGYKKNCTLVEYTPDFQVIRTWTLYGCWIKSITESGFEVSNSGGGRQITCSLEYDRAEMIIDKQA